MHALMKRCMKGTDHILSGNIYLLILLKAMILKNNLIY